MTRADYNAKCRERWSGGALRDALNNWHGFQRIDAELRKAMRDYHDNPMLEDLAGVCHNPDNRLSSFLWQLQSGLQPNRQRLDPLLDFEEHFQKIFLRRGLIIYCTALLEELEATPIAPTRQMELAI